MLLAHLQPLVMCSGYCSSMWLKWALCTLTAGAGNRGHGRRAEFAGLQLVPAAHLLVRASIPCLNYGFSCALHPWGRPHAETSIGFLFTSGTDCHVHMQAPLLAAACGGCHAGAMMPCSKVQCNGACLAEHVLPDEK